MTRYRLTLLLLPLVLAALCFTDAQAQTDARLTQYWAVPTYYNPGA